MPRISGVTIPSDKRIEVSLCYIFGVGPSNSKVILKEAGVNPDTRAKDLTEAELDKIRSIIDKSYKVEGDLRREVGGNIKRLRDIGSYVGSRHSKGLPAHGQRTKTNARTKRGKRVTMGSGRKAPAQKT